MSLRSIQFVRSVKLLTVRKEAFTARKWNSLSILRIFFGFAGEVREGLIVVSVRTVRTSVNIVYVIESAAYGVLFTSCLCQKPERARYERVRAFDTNNE